MILKCCFSCKRDLASHSR